VLSLKDFGLFSLAYYSALSFQRAFPACLPQLFSASIPWTRFRFPASRFCGVPSRCMPRIFRAACSSRRSHGWLAL
jgi:hypothetical protein